MVALGGLSRGDFYGHAAGGGNAQGLIDPDKPFRGDAGREIDRRGAGIRGFLLRLGRVIRAGGGRQEHESGRQGRDLKILQYVTLLGRSEQTVRYSVKRMPVEETPLPEEYLPT